MPIPVKEMVSPGGVKTAVLPDAAWGTFSQWAMLIQPRVPSRSTAVLSSRQAEPSSQSSALMRSTGRREV